MKEQRSETEKQREQRQTERDGAEDRKRRHFLSSMKPVQEEPNKDMKPHDTDFLNRTFNCDISAGTEETDAAPYEQNATEEAHTNIKPATYSES